MPSICGVSGKTWRAPLSDRCASLMNARETCHRIPGFSLAPFRDARHITTFLHGSTNFLHRWIWRSLPIRTFALISHWSVFTNLTGPRPPCLRCLAGMSSQTVMSGCLTGGDSQDTWIFKGPIRSVAADFPLGVYDCDNKIAWELQQAGYRVLNPALGLRSYHHHQCGYRSYEQKPAPDYGIRPPFLYVEPENLWGPCKAWQLSRRLRLPYLPWSMTTRRFCRYPLPSLICRVWNKLARTTGLTGAQD